MFMLTAGKGMAQAFPDVCLSPGAPPLPLPCPNLAMSSSGSPVVDHVLVECLPALHQMSHLNVSQGDQAGSLGGVASHVVGGPCGFAAGCPRVLLGGVPAVRLGDPTLHNCAGALANAAGAVLSPSQTTVMILG